MNGTVGFVPATPSSPPRLLPKPKRLRLLPGVFSLESCPAVRIEPKAQNGTLELARALAAHVATNAGTEPEVTRTSRPRAGEITLALAELRSPQHYRLRIDSTGVTATGGGPQGLFYAVQSLRQIMAQAGGAELPALSIDDGPDFPVRGFYHDVSRGKVPTRATLLELVERAAHYKLNQLQLYLEHTFAFARHPDVWAGSDPLTADDILAVDEHAARHHVELVPSLSTFGHFYTALVSPRKHHLNEFPIDASQLEFSWWDRMGHYTLDCANPASLELVREMILELRPLFRSRLFNLCCDETFDLGKGRNRAQAAQSGGLGRLYLGFLEKLVAVVREADAIPMFWGDIVGNHPELVGELSRPIVALDWDYSSDLRDTKARLFARAKVPFYACPGVCGWDRWIHDLDTATTNIVRFARHGKRHGAAGLLNTDWGDRGHVNALGNSMHGLALGAAAGWNVAGTEDTAEFDDAFSLLHWGDATGRATKAMREAGRSAVFPWRLFTLWLDPTPHRPDSWWDARTGLPTDLLAIDPRRAFAAATALERLADGFARAADPARATDARDHREFVLGCRGQAATNRLGAWLVLLARGRTAPRGVPSALDTSNALRVFERDFSESWHARNRPSEYWRLRTALLELARRLDLAALRGVWVKTPRPQPPKAADVPAH
ncbi:hypothetical protein ASA1KI_12580 [Opitutales bacterium ASA1]|uniref:glycoside hydrolase family 20 zincin-like fold domain-containing protein n=1 Tax=Congregicoccus parvus TaxID=3081749 RepID=UPI002B2B6B07|nr:hypothetical protein ASA1KI_12580 [Opitutales bacterium ASA1]